MTPSRYALPDFIGGSKHGKMSYATNTKGLGRLLYFGGLSKPSSVAHRRPSPELHILNANLFSKFCGYPAEKSTSTLPKQAAHRYRGYRRRTTTIIFFVWVRYISLYVLRAVYNRRRVYSACLRLAVLYAMFI